jgi:glycine cleavage system transcriptional repressor
VTEPVSSLAITVVGHDRPGIIADTAAALAGCGITAVRISSVNSLTGAPARVHINDFAFAN